MKSNKLMIDKVWFVDSIFFCDKNSFELYRPQNFMKSNVRETGNSLHGRVSLVPLGNSIMV